MGDNSARFALPFILPGQAQKEMFHNEALVRLDALVHAAVEEGPLSGPPLSPEDGQCWIVAEGASGDWSGKGGQLACWSPGGWRFIVPLPGTRVWDIARGYWIHYSDTGWSEGELPVTRIEVAGKKVLGERQPAILSPSGGTIIDTEARAALDQVIATLMSHGLIG